MKAKAPRRYSVEFHSGVLGYQGFIDMLRYEQATVEGGPSPTQTAGNVGYTIAMNHYATTARWQSFGILIRDL